VTAAPLSAPVFCYCFSLHQLLWLGLGALALFAFGLWLGYHEWGREEEDES
jgi:hypothetical protein